MFDVNCSLPQQHQKQDCDASCYIFRGHRSIVMTASHLCRCGGPTEPGHGRSSTAVEASSGTTHQCGAQPSEAGQSSIDRSHGRGGRMGMVGRLVGWANTPIIEREKKEKEKNEKREKKNTRKEKKKRERKKRRLKRQKTREETKEKRDKRGQRQRKVREKRQHLRQRTPSNHTHASRLAKKQPSASSVQATATLVLVSPPLNVTSPAAARAISSRPARRRGAGDACCATGRTPGPASWRQAPPRSYPLRCRCCSCRCRY